MPIVLPQLPDISPGERSRYCVMARHRAIPGRATGISSSSMRSGGTLLRMEVQWLVMASEYTAGK
jgi:hypothetical protein